MANHAIFDRPMDGPVPKGFEQAIFGMGCYWGVERLFWEQPGIWMTQVGFAGGTVPDPTYAQVCAGGTGHAEVVHLVYDPSRISYDHLLKLFWENHDPTQGNRQHNDIGDQYRSLIMYYTDTQRAQAEASKIDYDNRLAVAGRGKVTTQILPVDHFYPAPEPDHQQYLHKVPDGYCNMRGTGIKAVMPEGHEIPLMPTWTALTHVIGREAAANLADLCEDLLPEPVGTGIFEIEDGSDRWEVGAYFTDPPDEIGLALLAAAQGANPFVISELPEVDWVAHVKRELTPVSAGRFFVYGSHDADKIPPGAEALLIEAAMAFGTGHHNTTRGCLLALDRLIDTGWQPHRVADIGAGTAVLAMAAARVWPGTVLASDIDPVAVDVAEANVIANGLDGRVACFQAVGFDHHLLDDAAPFDLVFANILKQPLIDLAPDMARHVAHGGRAILSGVLTTQADEVLAAYDAAGFGLESREDLGDWSALVVQRR